MKAISLLKIAKQFLSSDGHDMPPAALLTDEEKLIRQAVRVYAEREIMSCRREIDADTEHKIVRRILEGLSVDLGIQIASFPKEHGGADLESMSASAAVLEEIARADSGIAVSASCTVWTQMPMILEPYRNDHLLREFSPMFKEEKLHLGCFAMTEPEGGCDIENPVMEGRTISTKAELDGDEWVINGKKQWPTNSGVASLYLTVCTTDPELGDEGIALIYVPGDAKGLSFSDFEAKAGMNADRNCTIFYDDVRVPKEYRVCGPGDDANILHQNLVLGSIGSAAISVGAAQNTFELVEKYASSRVVAGKPIKEHSINAGILADMVIGIETARTYTYDVAHMFDHPETYGPRWSPEMIAKARIAKVYAADVAVSVTNRAMELMASNGYSPGFDVEKHWRDIKETQLWLGGVQLGKLDIARYFCKLETL